MAPELVWGDICDQPVEVIVNAWNRNIIPWWLLLPQGVSGAIKRHAGYEPFQELARSRPMPLGSAVLTTAGLLPYKGIIHVAGINLAWRASEFSIRESVKNAMVVVNEKGFESVAFPVIGAGSGSFNTERALEIMLAALAEIDTNAQVLVVRWPRTSAAEK
ncbi:macro domain-containing protein [Armatimonas rosea]|uniref:O-acetyl-ADP-ribose deacetylase (Regulator of RNase III) n=1 Tax=Armatimonas rosea TaxID=685828 RepID=A0A7W9W930_ARMRO|nr:macro domain-containing protein [Armatimonas rosea]MBB6053403.1 O-acetyl-ADP-ribose deacetylase (regulator of RNase III) [Armatimonas rosea]